MAAKKKALKLFSILAMLAILLSNIQPQPAAAQGGHEGVRRRVSTLGGGDGLKRQVYPASGRVSFIGPREGMGGACQPGIGYVHTYTPVIVGLSGFETNALHTVTFSSETTGRLST